MDRLALVRRLTASPPVTVLVAGGTGMGKSWLAGRVMEGSRAAVTVVVGCRGLPKGPNVVVSELIAALGGQPVANADAYQVCRAVHALVARAGRTVLLVVEDADCADRESLQVLRYLATRPPPGAALLITCTPGDRPVLGARLESAAGSVHRVELAPLSPEDIAVLAGRPAGAWAEELCVLTGGVPLYVREALHGDGAVDELVQDRLADLEEGTRRVIRAASLVRGPARARLVAAACEIPEQAAESALLEATRAGLMARREGGAFVFTPPLVGRAVAAGVPAEDRCHLHAALARELETGAAPPEELVRHYRAAGELAAAARHAARAADRAIEAGDTMAAVALLQGLLGEADLPAEARRELAGKLGRMAITSLGFEETLTLLREILAGSQLPPGLRGELRMHLGLLMMNQACDAAGRTEIARATRELRRRPALAARAMSALALPYGSAAPLSEHLWWLAEAERTVPKRGDPALLTGVAVNRASALMQIGDSRAWAAAEALPDDGRTSAERLQLARGYSNLAAAGTALGYPAAAGDFLRRAEELAFRAGPSYPRMLVTEAGFYHVWATGQWEGLAERAHRYVTANADTPLAAANAAFVLGHLALTRGEWEEAAAFLRAPGLDDSIGWIGLEFSIGTAGRVRLATVLGEWPAEVEQALEVFRSKGVWVWAAELVDAALEAMLRRGAVQPARRLLEEFTADVSGRDCPFAHAIVVHGRAALAEAAGRLPEAVTLYAEAAAALAAVSRPHDQARALEAAGRCSLPDGIPQVALAARLFTSLGATWDAARCSRLLRDHGEAAEPRRGRRGYGTQLSPREREVARLIALGRTNKQIAEVLFLSPRTVEQHVARVMRKLGVAARDQIRLDGLQIT